MWILYGQEAYSYPEPFISISNYALNNEVSEPFTRQLKRKQVILKFVWNFLIKILNTKKDIIIKTSS